MAKRYEHSKTYQLVVRIIGILTVASGLNYIVWRYAHSLNTQALWFAIPMVIAETYGIIDMLLFVLMSWRQPERRPLPPPEKATVDVFITTYNEPESLIEKTARAALNIDWPDKQIYILDDGNRESMRKLATDLGCGYISRGQEWNGKPRHAKAGNINNALLQTSGEFILILDADQIPMPSILKKTLGFFADPKLAFVQTPQYFYNLPPGDPFGNEASLFYGPIQEGKDGWNASYFCGSNAVLRREALMQLGIREYVETMEARERDALKLLAEKAKRMVGHDPQSNAAIQQLQSGIEEAKHALDNHAPLSQVSDLVQQAVSKAKLLLSKSDLADIADTLRGLALQGDAEAADIYNHVVGSTDCLAQATARDDISNFSKEMLERINLARSDEAVPVQALATLSITEDMATAMHLHASGWNSVFYPEVLAYGLAPEDLGTALKQRLRWAQGTIQVFVRDNPLTKKGLTLAQRLMYFSTIYSYLSGFFNIVLLLAPIIYFFTGIAPVASWSWDFFARFIPFFILNKILFRVVGRGIPVWRGEQYNLAMFWLDIRAVLSVLSGKKLAFVVTPKERQDSKDFRLIWPQVLIIGLTVTGAIFAIIKYLTGNSTELVGLIVNLFWGAYNIIMLSVVIRALYYKLPEDWSPKPPVEA
ncbi:MAG TPA: glycosyltransferase [Rectinema sp.]|nr:glycosyltransferase [Rectinema sp.]HPK79778.1 glycosyltransferase [Rectinema sp.]HQE69143.1 glycosyltransferase [Rectinema sp.]HQH95030.1 glycosyltransferase [Rectinema sp.]HRU03473.1 glycosyltransferase [Rectinema sp.]